VYVTIRGLQARIAIAREQAATRRQLLSIVKLQYEKGVAAELQMRQVEGSLAQVDAQIPVLEAGLEAAMNAGRAPRSAAGIPCRTDAGVIDSDGSSLADAGSPAEMIRRRPISSWPRAHLAAATRASHGDFRVLPKVLWPRCWQRTSISSGNLHVGQVSS
jgi:outer membrane protein TolC